MGLADSAAQGFNVGQQLGTKQSGFALAMQPLIDKAKMISELALKSKFEVATQTAVKQAEMAADPEKQLYKQLIGGDGGSAGVGGMGSTGGTGVPGVMSQPGGGGMRERLTAIQSQLGPNQGVKLGPFDIKGLEETAQQSAGISSAQAAKDAIADFRAEVVSPEGGAFGKLLGMGLPGNRGTTNAYNRMRIRILTSDAGKAMTPAERELVESILPGRWDAVGEMLGTDPGIVDNNLKELEAMLDRVEARLKDPGQANQAEAWKQEAARMSPEDLKRIAGESQ